VACAREAAVDFSPWRQSMDSDKEKPDTSEDGPVNILVSSALSSQTGFLFMRSPISDPEKIRERFSE
jgi:hypothetical protein